MTRYLFATMLRNGGGRWFESLHEAEPMLAHIRSRLYECAKHIIADVLLPDHYHALLELSGDVSVFSRTVSELKKSYLVECTRCYVPVHELFGCKAYIFTDAERHGWSSPPTIWPLGSYLQWQRWGGDAIAERDLWQAAAIPMDDAGEFVTGPL